MHGDENTLVLLRSFFCCRNPEVELFLRERALPHEKNHRSRTYLIVAENTANDDLPVILAYFSLAIHTMDIDQVSSNTLRKKLHGMYFPLLGPSALCPAT
jgi:hypothetical protein